MEASTLSTSPGLWHCSPFLDTCFAAENIFKIPQKQRRFGDCKRVTGELVLYLKLKGTASRMDWSHPKYCQVPRDWGSRSMLESPAEISWSAFSCAQNFTVSLLYFQIWFQKFRGKLHQSENARLIAGANSFSHFKTGREEVGQIILEETTFFLRKQSLWEPQPEVVSAAKSSHAQKRWCAQHPTACAFSAVLKLARSFWEGQKPNQQNTGISLQCWVSEYLPAGLQQPDLSHSMHFFSISAASSSCSRISPTAAVGLLSLPLVTQLHYISLHENIIIPSENLCEGKDEAPELHVLVVISGGRWVV